MNKIVIKNREPQEIKIGGGGAVIGITEVLVNGVDVTQGSIAYVVVPTKTSELDNDSGFITQETDPTIPYYIKQITQADINIWNNKQDQLISGNNIKTINGNSIMGSGNLDIDTSYTAGTGIDINEENVISNTITSYNDLTDLPTIPTKTSDLFNDSDYVTSSELSEVATSGDYDDLTNKPTIPTQTSELENDSGYITNRVDDLINYYDKDFLYNLLPKVSGTGSVITLDNTYKSKLELTLSPSTLEQDGTPTPSSPQDIHTISGSNTIYAQGKNIFDKVTLSGEFDGSGNVNVNVNRIYTPNYYKVLPNTQYVSSSPINRMCFYDKNKNFISRSSTYNFTNFTTLNNSYFIRFDMVSTTDINTLQVELGTTPTSYTPYTLETKDIDLGDIEYCKIGNYEDRIFKNVESDSDYDETLEVGTWYLKKNIGKVVLDGTQTYGYSNAYGGIYYSNSSIANVQATQTGVMSNKAKGIPVSNIINQNGIGQNNEANRIIIKFDGVSSYNTDELIKQYFASNNYEVYYTLATPTYTEITGTLEDQLNSIQNAYSENEQTNISQINNDLPFQITATTLKDISNL